MLYLFVALKIPILLLGCIVWWAVRQDPGAREAPDDNAVRGGRIYGTQQRGGGGHLGRGR